jgi:hypothetical protein
MVKGRWEGRKVYYLYVGEKQVDMIVYWKDGDDSGWHSDSYPLIEVCKTAEEVAKKVLEFKRYI